MHGTNMKIITRIYVKSYSRIQVQQINQPTKQISKQSTFLSQTICA